MRSIGGFFKNLFHRIRAPNVSHREVEGDLTPAVQRLLINSLHRTDRAERRKVLWRRFTLVLLSVISMYTWVSWQDKTNMGLRIEQKPFRTISVTGSGWSTAHVAVIPIRGHNEGDPLGPAKVSNTPRYIYDTLELAKKESDLAAVVVYFDSGGGDVYASVESYRLIRDFAKNTKIPVYAYIPRVVGSGAYYMALGTREIIADPVAEIGSIGIIIERLKTYEFGRRNGIAMQSIKTGPHKDGGQWKRQNAADRAIDQRVIDVMFEYFLEALIESRSRYSLEELRAEAKKQGGVSSGAWFIARDAKEKGLIDKEMTFEEFLIYVTKNIAKDDTRKFRNADFVKYDEKISILDEWKSHFKKSQFSSSMSKEALKGDLGTCMPSIIDRILENEN